MHDKGQQLIGLTLMIGLTLTAVPTGAAKAPILFVKQNKFALSMQTPYDECCPSSFTVSFGLREEANERT